MAAMWHVYLWVQELQKLMPKGSYKGGQISKEIRIPNASRTYIKWLFGFE